MTIIEALLLGLVQGITEFIPVSSSGHLAIIENLLHIDSKSAMAFEGLAHLAIMAAVIWALRSEIKKLFIEFCRAVFDIYENIKIYFYNRDKKDARRYKKIISNNYRKLFLLAVIASVPAILGDYLFRSITKLAGENLLAPGMGLLITGIILLVADFFPKGKEIPRDISYGTALVIGLIQGCTMFPGISRTGVTLAVCLAYGFQRKFAVKYVFLMSVPVLLGSFITRCGYLAGVSGWQTWVGYVAGAAAAGIAAYFCIDKIMKVLQTKKFYRFSVYFFLIGAAAAAGSFSFV